MADRTYFFLRPILAALSLVVLASGILSLVVYRPTEAQAWEGIFELERTASLSFVTSQATERRPTSG